MAGGAGGIRPTSAPQAGAGMPDDGSGGSALVGRYIGAGQNNSQTYTPTTTSDAPAPMTLDQTLARLTQGMPQSPSSAQMPQQVSAQAPLQAAVQSQAGMPIFNQPAFSPMQQYMQRLGINRAPYNPGKFYNAGSQGYAAWRAPQNFQPQLTPQQTAASAAAAKPQQSELDKLRAELEDMRARQYGSYNNTGGGGGN